MHVLQNICKLLTHLIIIRSGSRLTKLSARDQSCRADNPQSLYLLQTGSEKIHSYIMRELIDC